MSLHLFDSKFEQIEQWFLDSAYKSGEGENVELYPLMWTLYRGRTAKNIIMVNYSKIDFESSMNLLYNAMHGEFENGTNEFFIKYYKAKNTPNTQCSTKQIIFEAISGRRGSRTGRARYEQHGIGSAYEYEPRIGDIRSYLEVQKNLEIENYKRSVEIEQLRMP